MKFKKHFLALMLGVATLQLSAQTRVACVGNSITFGANITNRALSSYPGQLQTYLGDDYIVKNFGVGGTTSTHNGNFPYITTKEYKNSLDFNPDIVLIKFGTNDSKAINMVNFANFKEDYQKIVDSYLELPSKPRVVLLTPIRCYMTDENDIYDPRIREKIVPAIEEIAYENNLEIFDNYSLFGKDFVESQMPDKLHPSSIGAGIMTMNYDRFLATDRDSDYNIFSAFPGGKDFNFHGYKGKDIEINGLNLKIVQPKKANAKHSWVIRARFWAHEPQLDIKLLELGFHVVYCDVANLYGSDIAVERWDKMYKLMTNSGLNKKVVLEGMSRGGLIIYNWAAQNPKKVSAIYGDAPVMDLKSWPMGEGKYRGSEEDVKLMLEAYDMESKQEMLDFKGNPIDHAKVIAKAKIPVIHVVGDADDIVPVAENTAIFAERLRKAGHDLKIISKSGVGHHPHSLSAPEQILRFILEAENLYQNYCVKPIRGCEYRTAPAGWLNNADWNLVADDITATLKQGHVDILMLGNSITQGAANKRKLTAGGRDLSPYFKEYSWESAGISGDRTQHLLWRLQNGEYNSATPKYVTVTIGVNNLGASDDAKSTYEGIMTVTEAAIKEFPDSKIILFGLLPTYGDKKEVAYYEIQAMLEKTKFSDQVTYINPTKYFTNSEGKPNPELYRPDNIHLIDKGYEVWANLIYKTIKELEK